LLNISLGSLSELSYTLLLAKDLKMLSEEEWRSWINSTGKPVE
jgi:four helix bundle protein